MACAATIPGLLEESVSLCCRSCVFQRVLFSGETLCAFLEGRHTFFGCLRTFPSGVVLLIFTDFLQLSMPLETIVQ